MFAAQRMSVMKRTVATRTVLIVRRDYVRQRKLVVGGRIHPLDDGSGERSDCCVEKCMREKKRCWR